MMWPQPPDRAARRLRIAAVHNRAGAGNDDDPRRIAGPGDQRDQRVVDDDHRRPDADAPQDVAHPARLGFAIDAGDADADGRRLDPAIARRLVDDLPQHPFEHQVARSMEVRARTAPFSDDTPASSARRHTVLVPPASMPRTCMGRAFYVRSTEWIAAHHGPPARAEAVDGARDALSDARRVLLDAIAARVFPSAVAHVGSSAGLLWATAWAP